MFYNPGSNFQLRPITKSYSLSKFNNNKLLSFIKYLVKNFQFFNKNRNQKYSLL